MSPFAALGLDEGADEREVKRAYAQKLRTTRPDEDPEGFQALNAAYKTALIAVRWREQAQKAEQDQPEQDQPEQDQPKQDQPERDPAARDEAVPRPPEEPRREVPRSAPELVSCLPEGEIGFVDVPESLFDYGAPRADGGIEFDFDAFSADLLAVTAGPNADLRAWLDQRMATWPLAMKPTLAPYVLHALDDEAIAISPEHLAIITEAFGLDDVLSGVDPLAVEQLRRANQQRWTLHEGGERARRLLARENRRELDSKMRVAGYPPLAAPALARMLTGPHATRWTALRWVPLVARRVVLFLRYISAGAIETLSPPIEPVVLERWQAAERLIGWLTIRRLIVAIVAMPILVSGVWALVPGSDPAETAQARVTTIWYEEGPTPQKAVDDYSAFIDAHPPPVPGDLAPHIATAMFNRSIVLGKMGKPEAAEASYRTLDDTFGKSQEPSTRLLVAKGDNNWTYLLGKAKQYSAVVAIASKTIERIGHTGDDYLGNDSLDVQAAKALINKADALEHLGDATATLATCDELLFRFKEAVSEDMNHLKATALDIKNDYKGKGTPGQAPFSVPGKTPMKAWVPQEPPPSGIPK